MAVFSLSGVTAAYDGAYEGHLSRLRNLTTAEVRVDYDNVRFGSGMSETFSYLFNPARKGHVDAALEVLRERTIDLSEEQSDSDRSPERL